MQVNRNDKTHHDEVAGDVALSDDDDDDGLWGFKDSAHWHRPHLLLSQSLSLLFPLFSTQPHSLVLQRSSAILTHVRDLFGNPLLLSFNYSMFGLLLHNILSP